MVNAATPVLMPWRDEVDAILWAGIPGQEGGHAVAAALLNEIEPAGRLVTTFPVADGATPGVGRRSHATARSSYDEGTFIGYRGHAAGRAPEPAYWFGHGLGYGDWSYGPALRHRPDRLGRGDQHRGARLAARSCRSTSTRSATTSPCAWSAGPASTSRPAGRSPRRSSATERMWRTWDTATASWQTLDGGELLVARGLGDVRHRLRDAP